MIVENFDFKTFLLAKGRDCWFSMGMNRFLNLFIANGTFGKITKISCIIFNMDILLTHTTDMGVLGAVMEGVVF